MLLPVITVLLCYDSFTCGTLACAGELPVMDDILVVSGQKSYSLDVTGVETTVITRDDIQKMNIQSIPELLETIASISLIERGTPGSQADITIRGSSHEAVCLLINGVRVHDPQTGHFIMDIPLDLSSIERIEFISGGGSVLSGSSASGGVIDIITEKNRNGVSGDFGVGSFGSVKSAFSYSGQKMGNSISVTAHGGRSDGYRNGSDVAYSGAHVDGRYSSDAMVMDWNLGYLSRRFGASDFYGSYPSFEETQTFNGGINTRYIFNDSSMMRIRIGSRGHGDDFTLIRNDPDVYRNTHYNRSYHLTTEYSAGFHDYTKLVIGAGTEYLGITSPSLGNHNDNNHTAYCELSSRRFHSQCSLSMRFDKNSREDSIFSPGLGVVVPFGDGSRFRFRTEKSFRSPTYTELYYDSPANRGDPALKSEHSLVVEMGLDTATGRGSAGITGFARKSDNVIDWIRYPDEELWSAANHGELLTSGIEMKCKVILASSWNLRFEGLLMNQKVSDKKGTISKYALNPAEETLLTVFSGPLISNVNGTFLIRYEKMLDGRTQAPAAVRISRKFQNFKIFFSVSNIFDEYYEESPGLPAPGRWLDLKVEYDR